jgi:hypothetical protein
LIKEIFNRRIPHILGSYLIAGTSLVLFIEYLVHKYEFPVYLPTMSLIALIGILPSVLILVACPPKVVPSVKLVFVQTERNKEYDT